MSTQAFLKVVSGARQGLNIPLTQSEALVIGRKNGELLLDDPLVSGTHAQLVFRNDGWVVQDLGSTNGTMIDGRLVRDAQLRPGAELAIMESYPRELEAGTITLLGYDQRPLDTVRVLRETPADGSRWGLENGDGVIRIHPTLLTVPLVDRDWGLRRSSP